ncbi:MAG TPA: YiiX/YebB-like N1pC/P60 family cysteine hydrolase [Steroidobacteraceae bacterium]|nr:YiiX/YebB-like N1pC/P60 family cysteine hydrolase [Steroidobacteraceae bacterium]HRX89689.1 YiiX/YebB-like N1pC/P60 family cysteine hydrolase [Steroidobacteraceae bacterium]
MHRDGLQVAAWLLWALSGCASFDPGRYATVEVASASAAERKYGLPLESGQIIVNEKPGGMSLFLALVAERFEPYVHAGVIVLEGDQPYVYEAFGTMVPRLTGSPNDGMRGGVRRVTLASFLKRRGIAAIYDPPPGTDRSGLVAHVRRQHAARTPFDGYFDATDPSRLYCIEFVARALEAAGSPAIASTPVSRNHSVGVALRWLKVAAPELLLAGSLIDESRRVALIARRHSSGQVAAYHAMKRELHARFQMDQRLGHVLEWRGGSLRLRPAVAAYLEAGAKLAAEGGFDDDPDGAARRLAARWFAPMSGQVRVLSRHIVQ